MTIAVEIVLLGCVAVLLFLLGVQYGALAFGAGVLLVCASTVGVVGWLGRDSNP